MDIQKRLQYPLVKPEELNRWILIGKEKLKSQMAMIKAISLVEDGIAARQAALIDTQDLAEELLYAEAGLGGILASQDKKKSYTGFQQRNSVLPAGINKKQSHIAQALHKHEDTIAEVVAEAREKGEVPIRQHVLHRIRTPHALVTEFTGNAENYTPADIIERVRSVLGAIDLDPASCEFAQKTVKAKKYYTVDTDGLTKRWKGRVFLNPPYGMPDIRRFTDKLITERDHYDAAILLTNDQTDTKWWQNCALASQAICLHTGRISFYTPKGRTSPTNGQSFFYFGDDAGMRSFIKVFSEIGLIVKVIYEY